MELTKDDLRNIAYNPLLIQKKVLDFISSATANELTVCEPTNPATMLLEAAAVMSVNTNVETKNVIRKKFANMAENKNDLFQHLSDDEMTDIFSVPAETNMVIYINLLDLKNVGYRPNGMNYVETTLPKYTEITIMDTSFTTLNEINIRLYDDNGIFVEQIKNDDDISIKDLGVLNSGIITDSESVPWIIFETTLKQVKRYTKAESVIPASGFDVTLPIEDKYYYGSVSYSNNNTNGTYVKLDSKYSEQFLDHNVPSAVINILDKNININIPDMYLQDGGVGGNVTAEVFSTKGYLYLPINKYTLDDFGLVLGNTKTSPQTACSANIAILANSRAIVDGGIDAVDTETLRNKIINNNTGSINTPVTILNLESKLQEDGFNINKTEDTLTNRIFTASKKIPPVTTDLLQVKQDIFFNTAELLLSEVVDNDYILTDTDTIVIKSGAPFKEVNGKVTLLDNYEVNYINGLSSVEKIDYFKTRNYYFTPFYYVVKKDDNITQSRIFNFDKPYMENLKILSKNNNIAPRMNINQYTMVKTDKGYQLIFSIVSNDDFKKLDTTKLKAQLKIALNGNSSYIYFDGSYDADTGYMSFDIDTSLMVTEDNYLYVENGASDLKDKLISLVSTGDIFFYTTDPTITDNSKFLQGSLNNPDSELTAIFNSEQIDITFGKELKYIWNKTFNTFTERKYLTYTDTVYSVYEEDVYEINPDTGGIFTCVTDDDGNKTMVSNILHAKGDYVLDADGNRIVKYAKGDVILDDNNLPTIDLDSGIVRYIDIIMFEYEFKAVTNEIYRNYVSLNCDLIEQWITVDLERHNETLLENTKVVFKSDKKAMLVSILLNKSLYKTDYKTSPKITLYVNDFVYDDIYIDKTKTTLGKILHDYLEKTKISLSEIKEKIIQTLGTYVVGVKIENIESIDNSETFTIADTTNRITINKLLDLNANNELIVKYDIDLELHVI